MNDKRSTILGDHIVLQRGITYKSELKGKPGPYLLGLASIQKNGGFKGDNLTTYGGESPENILLRPGDIYVSLKDVTQSADLLGAIARVPPDITIGRLTQDTVKLIFKDPKCNRNFIYWILRTPNYRAFCYYFSTGTTNLGLDRDDFLSFTIPEITPKRLRIVALLEDIETKIKLNRRMNRTLEAMALALFKSWFVDFDGHDDFVDSEMGPIPRGWEIRNVLDVIDLERGIEPGRKNCNVNEQGHPFIRVGDISGKRSSSLYTSIETDKRVLRG